MEELAEARAGRSLTETIDTTTPAGRMMMQMIQFCGVRTRHVAGTHEGWFASCTQGGPHWWAPVQAYADATAGNHSARERGQKDSVRCRKAIRRASSYHFTSAIPGAVEWQRKCLDWLRMKIRSFCRFPRNERAAIDRTNLAGLYCSIASAMTGT